MKANKQFVNTLEDVNWQWGSPTKLISDHAQVEISNRVLEILCALVVGDWQSEPQYQPQNFIKRHWQTIKHIANTVMDITGSPSYTWLLALMYTCCVCNNNSSSSLKNRTPLEVLTGSTPDMSPLLCFSWWYPTYCSINFPHELLRRWSAKSYQYCQYH